MSELFDNPLQGHTFYTNTGICISYTNTFIFDISLANFD